jgi:hypothetical protein
MIPPPGATRWMHAWMEREINGGEEAAANEGAADRW